MMGGKKTNKQKLIVNGWSYTGLRVSNIRAIILTVYIMLRVSALDTTR